MTTKEVVLDGPLKDRIEKMDNPQWMKRAKDILERTGAQDISSTGEGGADYVRAPVASAKETSKMAKDLVCGVTVDDNFPHRSTHAGQTYLFCSLSCKQEFDKEPERYVASARGSAPRRPGA